MEQKIPKKLHYIWVGGAEKPPLVQKCIESFHKFLGDYEITEWNENNFDISKYPLIQNALKHKNWALASDVMRMHIMYHEGGIYLDTDCEVIKPFGSLLDNSAFVGYENDLWLGPHVLAAVKNHRFFKECLSRYEFNNETEIQFSTNILTVHAVSVMAEDLYKIKLDGKTRDINGELILYAKEYFTPQDYMTGKLKLTENSYVIHRYTGTWHSKSKRFWANFARVSKIILGKHIFRIFENIVSSHYKKQVRKELKKLKSL